MTEEAKRSKAKDYVEGSKGKKHLINTSIADTPYINKVIKAYVHGDKEAEKQLYKEPVRSDKEQAALDELLKKLGVSEAQIVDALHKQMLPEDKKLKQMQKAMRDKYGNK